MLTPPSSRRRDPVRGVGKQFSLTPHSGTALQALVTESVLANAVCRPFARHVDRLTRLFIGGALPQHSWVLKNGTFRETGAELDVGADGGAVRPRRDAAQQDAADTWAAPRDAAYPLQQVSGWARSQPWYSMWVGAQPTMCRVDPAAVQAYAAARAKQCGFTAYAPGSARVLFCLGREHPRLPPSLSPRGRSVLAPACATLVRLTHRCPKSGPARDWQAGGHAAAKHLASAAAAVSSGVPA